MSGKKDDILDDILPLIHVEGRENVRKIISLLDGHIPQIHIDPMYKSTLRESLLSSEKESTYFALQIPWFRLMSGMSLVCTCFIAVFGIYRLWLPSEYAISPIEMDKNDTVTMYSEEGATRFAGEKFPSNPGVDASASNQESSQTPEEISPETFRTEKVAIDTEIADISRDIMQDTDITSMPIPEMIEARMTEASLPSTSTPATSDTTIGTSPAGSAMTSIVARTIPPVDIALEYPSIMKLYSKSEPWTSDEISTRTGSGLIVREVSTEKKSLILQQSYAKASLGNIVSSKIVYLPLSKMVRDPTLSYYLVPTIEHTLESGEKYTISLIRGYR